MRDAPMGQDECLDYIPRGPGNHQGVLSREVT